MSPPSRVLIWDLPTRLFHWLLTAGFLASFGIAQFTGEHSQWFPVHMIVGVSLGVVVLLRVVWGFTGSQYARFASFLYRPTVFAAYMRDALVAKTSRYAGHNPGSAYATFAILVLTAVVVSTGLQMGVGSEAAEEVHVPAAYALAGAVAMHIAGVLWHSWRHRENLTLTMVTGWKDASPADAIHSTRPLAAAVFAVLIAVMTVGLFRNFDRERGETKLPFVSTAIRLGEAED
jgi:cytochrome b